MFDSLTFLAPFAGVAFLVGFALYRLCQTVRGGSWRASLRRLGLTCMIVLSTLAFRGARLAGEKVGGGTNETNRAGVVLRAPACASAAETDDAAGANPVPKWDAPDGNVGMGVQASEVRSVNMASEFKDHRGDWIHSYFISAPLLDTHELFERIANDVK